MVEAAVNVLLRAARREDIPAVALCAGSSVHPEEEVGFGTLVSQRLFSDADRLSEAWRHPDRVGTEEVLVAELEGAVVGYVTVEDRGRDLELVNIDVCRGYQGRGIGTRLVRFVEETAYERGKIGVTLGTSRNAAGIPWKSFPWWQRRGYAVTGEEENAWTRKVGPGVREIRMRKDLLLVAPGKPGVDSSVPQ